MEVSLCICMVVYLVVPPQSNGYIDTNCTQFLTKPAVWTKCKEGAGWSLIRRGNNKARRDQNPHRRNSFPVLVLQLSLIGLSPMHGRSVFLLLLPLLLFHYHHYWPPWTPHSLNNTIQSTLHRGLWTTTWPYFTAMYCSFIWNPVNARLAPWTNSDNTYIEQGLHLTDTVCNRSPTLAQLLGLCNLCQK